MYDLQRVQDALNDNKIGCFPCDTIWGIIGAMTDEVAYNIRQLKKRSQDQGFIVLISDLSYLKILCAPLSPKTQKLIQKYWPGEVTFILPKHPNISKTITGSENSIAIRLPKESSIQLLLQKIKQPLLSTSVNLSGEPELYNSKNLNSTFKDKLAFCIDPSPQQKGRSSTIVNCMDKSPSILRQGSIQITLD